jgi:urease accessory protein
MVNPGGAYLGADVFVIEVEVEAGADLLLTTQSATKVYRTPG